VPTEPNAARFAGVSGTRISVPSSDDTFSGLSRPVMTARQSRSSCPAQDAPSTIARSSSSGSGPRAFRQSPSARSDAGTQARAHGTGARSPASAMSASRTPAPGMSVISTMTRIMNALASSRSRSPFTYLPRSTARSAIPSTTPGPACSPSLSSSGPRVACAAGLPCAWTRPSRRTIAGATATTLQNTVTSPVRIRAVPPVTSADRSPASPPFLSGDNTSARRNATITPAGTSVKSAAARDATGYKETEAPVVKS
jgi:hypothetical protein